MSAPPGPGLPPVPTGLQRLLRLASVDDRFRDELIARRADLAAAAGVELTASERAILVASTPAALAHLAASLPAPSGDRRSFLRQSAASAVVLLGGAALADVACGSPREPGGGAAPAGSSAPPAGAPDAAGPAGRAPSEDAAPAGAPLDAAGPDAVARPERPSAPPAGIRPEPAPPRPDRPAPTRGIRPHLDSDDLPPERPDRPETRSKGGIRPGD